MGQMNRTKARGFSLIELLIVVAIILVIAAIAIPNYWKARMMANESSAASSVRAITSAETAYLTAYPTVGYGSITNLGGASPCTPSSATGCFIDNNLATASVSPGKSGYIYSLVPTITTYFVAARPVAPATSGTRSFCSTEDAVIRTQTTGGAIASRNACSALPGMN
jgi:type IV pilus assembly protein PilA